MENVVVVIGAGQIGQAIARRVGVGKHIVLADVRAANAETAAKVLGEAGHSLLSKGYGDLAEVRNG
jgi:malate/lactate dehydrogenase